MSWDACFCTASGVTGFGPMLFPGRVREAALLSHRLGFDGIEIAMRAPEELERRELEALLRETGLRLAALGSGRSFFEDGLSLTDAGDGGRSRAVARVVDLAEYAAAFEVPLIIGLVRGKAPADGDLAAAVGRFVESMEECLERTAACGGRFLVEAINRYETPLLNTAAETLAAVERIGGPRVAVLLDAFHMNIEEVSIGAAIRDTGGRLGHFHIVDSNRRAAGMGHVDFAEVAAALRDIRYDGWISAEILPLPDDTAAAEQAWRFAATINDTPVPGHEREGRDDG
jgi:sugar phosphate isomerase/epimerase